MHRPFTPLKRPPLILPFYLTRLVFTHKISDSDLAQVLLARALELLLLNSDPLVFVGHITLIQRAGRIGHLESMLLICTITQHLYSR